MESVDRTRVDRLVDACLSGLQREAAGATPSEVFSACFTVAHRTIGAALAITRPEALHQTRAVLLRAVDELKLAVLSDGAGGRLN
jgi:hypothetical protein